MTTPEAVVEIGSTGVRLLVAELAADGKRNVLDRAEMPVALGRDIFTGGIITRETQSQCLHILLRFREQLESWGITPPRTSVIATSALREAKNTDSVIDKILFATGFKVRVIDGIEENRLMYMAVTECLKEEADKLRSEDSVILEVGGGSTEMMLMRKGKMAGAHSLRLGTIRMESQVRTQDGSFDNIQRYIQDFIQNMKGSLESELNLTQVKQFIAIGADATLAAVCAGRPISTWLWSIEREDFDRFVSEVQDYTVDECVARFKISYNDAQTLRTSLLIYKMFIHLTDVRTIIVPETNIRDGLIISRTDAANDGLQNEFHQQIIASARNLLRKYHGDEQHAEFVRSMSLQIYSSLASEISLDEEHSKMLLEVAAILHDIGIFIRHDDHNIHSEYIIHNSEIFGLNKMENKIVSQIARYHRGKQLPQDNEQFQILARTDRMTILKLASILRIADAMDRGHVQYLSDISIALADDVLSIRTRGIKNLTLERMALSEKGELFESVFGYQIVLL
ncbi:MAG: HD domain-containing protein [Treponemataceae bacterium]|nr:HD domain-containing protein [Treponemataceae bacterium]